MTNQQLAEIARQRHRDQYGRFMDENGALIVSGQQLAQYVNRDDSERSEGMLSGKEKESYVRQLAAERGRKWGMNEQESQQFADIMASCNNYVRLSDGRTVELLFQPPVVYYQSDSDTSREAHDRFMRENLKHRRNLNVDAWENLGNDAGRPYLTKFNQTAADDDPARILNYGSRDENEPDRRYLTDEDMLRLSDAEQLSRQQYVTFLETQWAEHTTGKHHEITDDRPQLEENPAPQEHPLSERQTVDESRPSADKEVDDSIYLASEALQNSEDTDQPDAPDDHSETVPDEGSQEDQPDVYTTMGYDPEHLPSVKRNGTARKHSNDRFATTNGNDWKPSLSFDNRSHRSGRIMVKALSCFIKFVWRI
ncbi:hypothetical protein [Bifidobacterium sp. SO1]|uniref:hypothetical protein n=1 Tax=Bifidobacterium sp. SO1 TaxID=2809029 RepID=UPI001BDBBB0D|nr:hypothetical protein [Bifidobacterium sp. SO1]MBT1162556.1 hypothetical protein [Bifidobacterium sp. SO1]